MGWRYNGDGQFWVRFVIYVVLSLLIVSLLFVAAGWYLAGC